MFCKNCGEQVNKTSKFCKGCGQEVKVSNLEVAKSKVIHWIKDHKKVFIIVGVVLVLILLVVAFDDSSSNLSKTSNFNPASSVVNILCTAKNSGVSSGGSGTIISDDGFILTNAHIIPQIGEVPSVQDDLCLVILPDEYTGQPKEIYYAEPEITKGLSREYDIATLQIAAVYVDEDGEPWGVFPNTFPEFHDSPNCEDEYIHLGDSVRIYGYPVTSGGYNLTITEGIVSSFGDDGTILTSAKIDSGNSGGLAIDQYGCFIGIPSAVVEGEYQNLGVIIPPDIIREFGDRLENFDTSSVTEDYRYEAVSNRPNTYTEPYSTKEPASNYRNLEDRGQYPNLPQFGSPTVNMAIPYYYSGNETILYSLNGNYTPATGDLNQYSAGNYSMYDRLYFKKDASFSPTGFVYWGLANHISGYVIIKAGKIGNPTDLYVKDPSACDGTKEGWFNKMGIKISIYNERFSSTGYLNRCESLTQNKNAAPPYYYIGSLLPDTYTVDITLPAGWKLSEASGNVISSGATTFPRQITIGEGAGVAREASLWFYIEPIK